MSRRRITATTERRRLSRGLREIVMPRFWPLTLAAGAALPIDSIPAQRSSPSVEIDWPDNYVNQRKEIRSRSQVMTRLLNASPLCFSYTVRVNQVAAAEDDRRLPKILLGDVAMPGELAVPTSTAPVKDSKPSADKASSDGNKKFVNAKKDSSDKKAKDDRFAVIEAELAQVDTALIAAATGLNAAREALGPVVKSQEKAKASLTSFYEAACPPKERGAKQADVNAKWQSTAPILVSFVNTAPSIETASSRVSDATTKLSQAKKIIDGVRAKASIEPYREYLATPNGNARITLLTATHDGLEAGVGQLAKTVLEPVAKDRKSVEEHTTTIKRLVEQTPWKIDVGTFVREDVERLGIVVAARGRDGIPTVADASFNDTYEVPVRRRGRFVNSVGFLMSAIDDHDFARATLPRFSGDTLVVKDSVYSTYVDRGRSPRFAVAPLIQAHVSAYDFSNVTTYISGGVGARSVNGKLMPEFLAGASLGILDKVLVTVGWHWARTERLLLGDVNEVSKLPVPSTVTDDSAVGVKWDHKIAFALSWKL